MKGSYSEIPKSYVYNLISFYLSLGNHDPNQDTERYIRVYIVDLTVTFKMDNQQGPTV